MQQSFRLLSLAINLEWVFSLMNELSLGQSGILICEKEK